MAWWGTEFEFGRFIEQQAHACGGTIKRGLVMRNNLIKQREEKKKGSTFTNIDGCHSLQLYQKAS